MMTIDEFDTIKTALRPGVIVEEYTPYCWMFRDIHADKILFTIFNEFNPLQVAKANHV